MASGGGSGGGGSQTVTQVQQIPQFEQQFAQDNQSLAQSLASQPYPTYNAPLISGFTPTQQAGQQAAIDASGSYQPALNAGMNATQAALSVNPLAGNPSNPGVISGYMSPYVASALAPQITALQTQLGQQQNAINGQATQAGAFGDARHGVESALANFYGNQNMAGVVGAGYNTAFSNALQTAEQQQQLGLNEQNLGLQGGQQLANMAGLAQSLGLSGANAIYNVGSQQQQLNQQELNAAYQQFQNQVNWPYQQLNVRESALSNSPYNITNSTTLPNANMTAQNLGTFSSLAGMLGSLTSGGSTAPFGGSSFNAATAHA